MSAREHEFKHISHSGIYKSFFMDHPDAVYVLDLQGNYVDVNPACLKVFGYALDDLLNMSFKQLLVPEKLDDWSSTIVRQWHEGKSVTFETTIVHQDGHLVQLQITDVPIVTDGNIAFVFGIAKDVTEQRNVQKLLKERSERYESLKKYNPNGICSFSSDGSVMGANPAYERITGYTLEELRQMNLVEMLIDPKDWEWARATFKHSFKNNVEMQIKHKQGHAVDVSVSSVPIVVEDEQIGVYIILQDITVQKNVQNELLLTQRLFTLISENSQDVISCGTRDGNFAYLSPSIKPLLGYDPNELIGKPTSSLYHPDDVPYLSNIGRRIIGGEDIPRFTCRVKCKNGSYLWYETTLKIVRDDKGNLLELIGVGRDVSEQINLQESLEHAVAIANLGHWEWDIASDNLHYSSQGYRNLGLEDSPEKLTYDKFTSFVHPEDVELWKRSVKVAIETGNPFDRVFRIVRQDGSIRYLHSRGEVLFNESGEPIRMIGVAQDITHNKLLELKLQQSEERYRSLVENSLDAIGIFEDRKWVYMNAVGLRMFGATHEDEIIGRDYFEFLDESHHAESKKRLQSIMSKDQVKPIEYKWKRKNGEAFYAEALGSYFSTTAVQVCIRDVTERKKTSELLVRSEKLTAVGQLAAGVAHEIRNPLTALKGFTQMLHEKSRGPNRRYFEIMKGELNRIEMILTELLVLGKPQVTHFKRQPMDLILHEVITLLSTQAVMKGVSIQTDFGTNLPAVSCDENQLKQVFVNIIKNGIEAMPSGGNLLVRLKAQNDALLVEFIDEGEGIPADKIPKLGEPFFTTKEKGTGLGLMVSHKIICAHSGKMDITSQVGQGTTVRIELPASVLPI